MKIRNGFVSNSSSSSFILRKGGEFDNAQELAIHMLGDIGKQDLIDLIKKSSKDPNTNIAFHSCNYDTYITTVDNLLLVQTCNNEDWSIHDEVSYKEIRETHPELLDGDYDELSYDNDIRKKSKFWFLNYNLMVSKTKTYEWCKEHDIDFFVINGKEMCPVCYNKKHLERIQKLKRLIK